MAALAVDRAIYSPGEEIAATLTVRNPGESAIEIKDPSGFAIELDLGRLVQDERGRLHFDSLTSREYPREFVIPPTFFVKPGESRVFHVSYAAPYETARYRVALADPRVRAQFEVRNPRIVEIAEIARTTKGSPARVRDPGEPGEDQSNPVARALVNQEEGGTFAILLAILPRT